MVVVKRDIELTEKSLCTRALVSSFAKTAAVVRFGWRSVSASDMMSFVSRSLTEEGVAVGVFKAIKVEFSLFTAVRVAGSWVRSWATD